MHGLFTWLMISLYLNSLPKQLSYDRYTGLLIQTERGWSWLP